MRDEDILKFLNELDIHSPKGEAEAKLVAYGETVLYANKEGVSENGCRVNEVRFRRNIP